MVMLETVDEVFPPSMIDTEMKIARVGIALFEICDSRVLTFSRFFKNRQANDPPLESFSKISLIRA